MICAHGTEAGLIPTTVLYEALGIKGRIASAMAVKAISAIGLLAHGAHLDATKLSPEMFERLVDHLLWVRIVIQTAQLFWMTLL